MMGNKNQIFSSKKPYSRKPYARPILTQEKNFGLVVGISVPFEGQLGLATNGSEA